MHQRHCYRIVLKQLKKHDVIDVTDPMNRLDKWTADPNNLSCQNCVPGHKNIEISYGNINVKSLNCSLFHTNLKI